MLLTLEQKIEICNAINTAVAKGKTVYVGDTRVVGACHGLCTIRAIGYYAKLKDTLQEAIVEWNYDKTSIRAFIPAETEVDIIYEPPNRINVASSQDLSEPSP